MRLTHLVATAAALSLMALPVLAAPKAGNPAAKLSLADEGGGSPTKRAGKAGSASADGALSTPLVAGLAVAAVVAGAVALGKHDSKAASS